MKFWVGIALGVFLSEPLLAMSCAHKSNSNSNRLVLQYESSDLLTHQALEAANRSYAPFSKMPAGVAIELKDQRIFLGSYLEYSDLPRMWPIDAALLKLIEAGASFDQIAKVVIIQKPGFMKTIDQIQITKNILKEITHFKKVELYSALAVEENQLEQK